MLKKLAAVMTAGVIFAVPVMIANAPAEAREATVATDVVQTKKKAKKKMKRKAKRKMKRKAKKKMKRKTKRKMKRKAKKKKAMKKVAPKKADPMKKKN